VLATDLVGTHLAKWFGLSTFDIAIPNLDADDEFDLTRGAKAKPGPAFASWALPGDPWGKSRLQLDLLVNPEDISRLVIFDTWTLNGDRPHHNLAARKPHYDNVYLSSEGVEPGRHRLIAMDHGLCFIHSGEDLTPKLAHIDKVQDDHVFGLFPDFRGKLRVRYDLGLRAAVAGDERGHCTGNDRDGPRPMGGIAGGRRRLGRPDFTPRGLSCR
jgi:hypothetical protein